MESDYKTEVTKWWQKGLGEKKSTMTGSDIRTVMKGLGHLVMVKV